MSGYIEVKVTIRTEIYLRYLVAIGHAKERGNLIDTMVNDYIQKHYKALKELPSWKHLIELMQIEKELIK